MNYSTSANPVYTTSSYPWRPTPSNPYPMTFMQAPSSQSQITVIYDGQPMRQGLSTNYGPVLYPTNNTYTACGDVIQSRPNPICYPLNSSIPGPYLQSYIALPRRIYPY